MENGSYDDSSDVMAADVAYDTAAGNDHQPGYSDLVKVRRCVMSVITTRLQSRKLY